MSAALPLALSFTLALSGVLGGFALTLQGWSRIDRERRIEGCTLMLAGWLLGIAAMTMLRLGPAAGVASGWF